MGASAVPVCFFESMEYQRVSRKVVTPWAEGLLRGFHAKCTRKQLQLRIKLAFREVITYMTVSLGTSFRYRLKAEGSGLPSHSGMS